jgi:hypothetical protein
MTLETTQLGAMALKDWKNAPVVVGSAWAEQPAILVWLRHFG